MNEKEQLMDAVVTEAERLTAERGIAHYVSCPRCAELVEEMAVAAHGSERAEFGMECAEFSGGWARREAKSMALETALTARVADAMYAAMDELTEEMVNESGLGGADFEDMLLTAHPEFSFGWFAVEAEGGVRLVCRFLGQMFHVGNGGPLLDAWTPVGVIGPFGGVLRRLAANPQEG